MMFSTPITCSLVVFGEKYTCMCGTNIAPQNKINFIDWSIF